MTIKESPRYGMTINRHYTDRHENGRYYAMKTLLLIGGLVTSLNLFSQQAKVPCCTIVDLAKEEGIFTIRDSHTGRMQTFKPDALEGAELKIGDTVDAVFDTKKITSVKGTSRSYDLMDAPNGNDSCVILKMDSILNEPSWRITAKNNTTGENIHFNVPKTLAARLSPGNFVYTQPTHGYAMISAALSDSTTNKFLFGFPLLQETNK